MSSYPLSIQYDSHDQITSLSQSRLLHMHFFILSVFSNFLLLFTYANSASYSFLHAFRHHFSSYFLFSIHFHFCIHLTSPSTLPDRHNLNVLHLHLISLKVVISLNLLSFLPISSLLMPPHRPQPPPSTFSILILFLYSC